MFIITIFIFIYYPLVNAQVIPTSTHSVFNYAFVNKWNNSFNAPTNIKLDPSGQFIYVVDSQNNRIQKFNSNGFNNTAIPLVSWGSYGTGNGQFRSPTGIAIDPSGNVYVADSQNNRIQKFDSNGQYLFQKGTRCVISAATPPCIDADGSGPLSLGDEQFFSPTGIAIDPSGNVYVADSQNNRIQKFDSNGVFLSKWGSFGLGDGKFKVISDVAVDPSGKFVYAVDKGNHRIQKFDLNGTFLSRWGSFGQDIGQFYYPLNIAVDPNGRFVYVADSQNNRIQKFDLNGTFFTTWGSSCYIPSGSGCVYPQGSVNPSSLGNGQFSSPEGIAFDPSGTFIYVVDSGNNRIQTFAPDLFGNTINLSNASNNNNNIKYSQNPELAAFGNNLYAVWQGVNSTTNITPIPGSNNNSEIFLKKSIDKGTNFGLINNLTSSLKQSMQPSVTINGHNVYVAWTDNSTGKGDIYFKRSTNDGRSFDRPIPISGNAGVSENPKVLVNGHNVYVAWTDNSTGKGDIYFKRSTNDGRSFDRITINLSNDKGKSLDPQIVSPPGTNNIYVVWADNTTRNNEILFKKSTNDGRSFTNVAKNLSGSIGDSLNPQIGSSSNGNNVYVVWTDNSTGKGDIYFKRSSNEGNTFTQTINLSNNSYTSSNPRISTSGNNVYVAWDDKSSGYSNILFAKSADNGMTFNKAIDLSSNLGSSKYPHIDVSGNNVYVIWQANNPVGATEVYFVASADNGNTFDSVINLSNNPGRSENMKIMSYTFNNNNHVYVVWTDDTLGNSSIFYKKTKNIAIPLTPFSPLPSPVTFAGTNSTTNTNMANIPNSTSLPSLFTLPAINNTALSRNTTIITEQSLPQLSLK